MMQNYSMTNYYLEQFKEETRKEVRKMMTKKEAMINAIVSIKGDIRFKQRMIESHGECEADVKMWEREIEEYKRTIELLFEILYKMDEVFELSFEVIDQMDEI